MTRGATCLQFGDGSPPNPEQTPQGGSEGSRRKSRKVEPKVAERMPQGKIEGRQREPQGDRGRSGWKEPARWSVVGKVASLELPCSARAGVVRHDPGTVPAGRRRRSPEEHGRLRPNGYSGLRRVWGQMTPRDCRCPTRPLPTVELVARPGPPGDSSRPAPARGRRGGSHRCSDLPPRAQ